MNKLNYFLLKLAEESNEVGKEALKSIQFGLDSTFKGNPQIERLHSEITDFLNMIEILNRDFNFNYKYDASTLEEKELKIKHFLKYTIDMENDK